MNSHTRQLVQVYLAEVGKRLIDGEALAEVICDLETVLDLLRDHRVMIGTGSHRGEIGKRLDRAALEQTPCTGKTP